MSAWYLPILPYLKKYELCGVITILLIAGLANLYNKNLFLHQENAQLRLETDGKEIEIQELRGKLGEVAEDINQYTGNQKNIADFEKDWDISQFYKKGEGTYCPKHQKQNYKRIFYRHETPITSSRLHLKFQIEDQEPNTTNYIQRIVAGLEFNQNIYSEYDVPTRDNQIVNFRVNSDGGELKSGGPGKPLSSPIKDKSIIDLVFRTQYKSGEEISQFINLSYFPTNEEYGKQSPEINYDSKINDPNPKTTKASIFIGSYSGGCIKILEWKVN